MLSKSAYPFFIALCTLCFSSCESSVANWSVIGEALCNTYANCINGTSTSSTENTCICDCDDGWCGERCGISKAVCQGIIVDNPLVPGEDCYCSCISPFTNPPLCNTLEIPLKPKSGISSILAENKNNYLKNGSGYDYYPLVENNSWTYDVLDTSGMVTGQFAMRIGNLFTYQDTQFWNTDILLPDTVTNFFTDTFPFLGPLLFDDPSNPIQIIHRENDSTYNDWFRHSYTNGDTILVDGDIYISDSVGTVVLPIATFEDCFSVRDTFEQFYLFAPNIGWIAAVNEGDTTLQLSEVQVACQFGIEIEINHASCSGAMDGSFELSSEMDLTELFYNWEGPTDIPDGANPINLSPGIYSLTVANTHCEASIDSLRINSPPAIEIILDSITHIDCPGASNGMIDIAISGGTGPLTTSWTNGSLDEDLTDLQAGCYDVIVMDSMGCQATASFEIMAMDSFNISANTIGVSCAGASDGLISLNVSGLTPPYSYFWINGEAESEINNLDPGDYSITISDSNGCEDSIIVIISEPDHLLVNLVSLQLNNCSEDEMASIDIEVTGGTQPYNIVWSNGQTGTTIPNLAQGSYSATVTDANNCSTEVSYEVPIVLPIDIDLEVAGNVQCNGADDGFIHVNAEGGTGNLSFNWNTGQDGAQISGLGPGAYVLVVTDENGCSNTFSYEIFQPLPLEMTDLALLPIQCYGGSNGAISVDIEGGIPPYTYVWNNVEGASSIQDLVSDNYFLQVIDNNGCTFNTSFILTQPDSISIETTEISDVACFGDNSGSIETNINGGTPPYQYAWSNATTDQDLSFAAAGDYSLIVTDNLNCTQEAHFTIAEPLQLEINLDQYSEPACADDMTGSISIIVAGGTGPYEINWDNGSTGISVAGLGGGLYTANVTDSNNCTEHFEFEINEPVPLELVLSSTPSPVDSMSGEVVAVVQGGTPPYNYLWNDAAMQTGSSATDLSPGDYVVTVSDSQGCTIIDSATVEMTTSVLDELKESIALYPNPAGNILNLEMPTELSYAYDIMDLKGQTLIRSNEFSRIKQIDISQLNTGMYLLRININGDIMVFRFLKM